MANPGVTLQDVREAASMPIALAQCRKSLARLGLKRVSASDAMAIRDSREASRNAAASPPWGRVPTHRISS